MDQLCIKAFFPDSCHWFNPSGLTDFGEYCAWVGIKLPQQGLHRGTSTSSTTWPKMSQDKDIPLGRLLSLPKGR